MADSTTTPTRQPRVAVVTPVFNKVDLTLRFLESFQKTIYPRYTIVITDDGSTDGTAEAIARRFPQVVVLKGDGNLWWTGGTNVGVRYALDRDFDYVLTINNDVTVYPEMLGHQVATAEANPRTIVGARNNYMEWPEKIFSVGARTAWHLLCPAQLNCCGVWEKDALHKLDNPCPVETLSGCGTLIPIQCFREVGLYDRFWCPQYHADSEFVLRASRRAGYKVVVDLNAVLLNDVPNTTTDYRYSSIRSVLYWRPNIIMRWRYAPRKQKISSLYHFLSNALSTMISARFRKLFRRPAIDMTPRF